MATIIDILKTGVDNKASDIHITVGVPPKMRVNGKLVTMNFDRLMPQDTKMLAESIMNDKQKQWFEDKGEVDFSYGVPDLGRYRVNAHLLRYF